MLKSSIFYRVVSVAMIYLLAMLLMAFQKPIFLAWYVTRSIECSIMELVGVSFHGLYLDSTVAGYLSVVPWLVLLVSVWVPISERVYRKFFVTYIIAISLVVSLLVAVDMALFRYWDFRLDSTILPYLATPKEAAASVTWGDLWPAVVLFLCYAGVMIVSMWPIKDLYRSERGTIKYRVGSSLLMLLVGGLLFLAIRGGVSPAAANVSKVYFSENMFLNQAATNPVFSFLSSAMRSELKASDYQYFSKEECDAQFESMRGGKGEVAEQAELLKRKDVNVVLIMLESFGRATTDLTVDGREVTPYLNKLKQEGVNFENIYANSFRTDRGTVAVMSGYPTHPVVSVMKYPQKAHTLPSIAGVLAEAGYATSFMYGGDANFTNTSSYLYGTGIQKITDQDDIKSDAPTDKWGYDDRVVCEIFRDEVLELSEHGKPFFATLLTLSSHEPFEVPFDAFEDKILNSTAFADEQVGRMIDAWRESPAWENMLVVLIADHGISYPADLAIGSVGRQRIPMIWCGGAIKEHRVIENYASQADMAVTLLSQLGVKTDGFELSRNILAEDGPHFGYWSFNNGFGMISDEGYLIYDCTGERVIDKQCDDEAEANFIRQGKVLTQKIHEDICRR